MRADHGRAPAPVLAAKAGGYQMPSSSFASSVIRSGDQGGDKSRWISDFFGWVVSTDIQGLIWFEVDGRPNQPDWRLTSSSVSTAAAKSGLMSW